MTAMRLAAFRTTSAAAFLGRERSWDWCFEHAARKFYRAARLARGTASLLEIGMARHLHGQIIWSGWDPVYERQWREAEKYVDGTETA
jgi:hypothetical protein